MMKRTGIAILAVILLIAFSGTAMAEMPATQAKNIILMIGDGMGGWHVDATRKYLDSGPLAMESLRYHGYMTTFMRNSTGGGTISGEYWDDGSEVGDYDPMQGGFTPWEKVPSPEYLQLGATDSAAAASTMADGFKCAKYTLNAVAKDDGYDDTLPYSVKYHPTIVDIAEGMGKATGLVTSVNFNHATPAGFIVKTQYRKNYGEKARQMVYSDVDVIMGGGHPYYDDNGTVRTPDFYTWGVNQGPYLDNIDGEALYNQVAAGFKGRTFIDAQIDFEDLADGDGQYNGGAMPLRVFGLAQVADTLQHDRNIDDGDASDDWQVGGQAFVPNVPTLDTMTKGALGVLEQDEDGFFLMVEGGAVDWASHAGDMTRMLEENIDFDAAVASVIEWIEDDSNGSNWNNTLLIITADHECGHLQPAGAYIGDDVITNQCWGVGCAGWGDHTNSLVPIYAQGPGSWVLRAKYYGDYKDNTDIFTTMFTSMTGIKFWPYMGWYFPGKFK